MIDESSVLLRTAACLEEQAAVALALATELETQALELRALAMSTPLPAADPAPERETREDPPVSREQLVFDLIVSEGELSSSEIGDRLGLTEWQVRPALRRLASEQKIKRIGWQRGVRWVPFSDPRRASSQTDDIEAIVRDWVRQTTDEFTIQDACEATGLEFSAAARYLGRLVKRDVLKLRRSGLGYSNRKAFYRYVPPRRQPVNRPRREPPEAAVVGKRVRGGTIQSARTPRPRNKDVADLLEAITAAGGEIVRASHSWKIRYNGEIIGIVPLTPKDHRAVKNARANLKRAGLALA